MQNDFLKSPYTIVLTLICVVQYVTAYNIQTVSLKLLVVMWADQQSVKGTVPCVLHAKPLITLLVIKFIYDIICLKHCCSYTLSPIQLTWNCLISSSVYLVQGTAVS